jgi:hypothetical protein
MNDLLNVIAECLSEPTLKQKVCFDENYKFDIQNGANANDKIILGKFAKDFINLRKKYPGIKLQADYLRVLHAVASDGKTSVELGSVSLSSDQEF